MGQNSKTIICNIENESRGSTHMFWGWCHCRWQSLHTQLFSHRASFVPRQQSKKGPPPKNQEQGTCVLLKSTVQPLSRYFADSQSLYDHIQIVIMYITSVVRSIQKS